MDPVEQALMEHYKMSPELAKRVAANLRNGGDFTGYEAARQPAPQPQPTMTPEQQRAAIAAMQGQINSAVTGITGHPLQPDPDQMWRQAMSGYEYTLGRERQAAQMQQQSDLASAQAAQDEIDAAIRQKRVAHYHQLIEQQKRGADIGEQNRAWLDRVHSATPRKGGRSSH